jgi:hypothetical protein
VLSALGRGKPFWQIVHLWGLGSFRFSRLPTNVTCVGSGAGTGVGAGAGRVDEWDTFVIAVVGRCSTGLLSGAESVE